jgi:hypothetical protein
VDELFTDANIVTLNEMLVERGISPDRIITIVMVPGQTMVTPTPPQFRVLYRATPKHSRLTINLRVCPSWRAYASLAGSPRCAWLPGISPIASRRAYRRKSLS